jgi:hypothetical protein
MNRHAIADLTDRLNFVFRTLVSVQRFRQNTGGKGFSNGRQPWCTLRPSLGLLVPEKPCFQCDPS